MKKISQKMLRQYHEFAEQERQLKRQRLELRGEPLGLLESGATAQDGRYTVRMRRCETRPLSQKAVRELLGEAELEWLLGQIAPEECATLLVKDRLA